MSWVWGSWFLFYFKCRFWLRFKYVYFNPDWLVPFCSPTPLLSHSLLEVFPDHLNAEIVAGTITSKQDAMDYVTWTYFFRRLLKNPSYYHLEEAASINHYLSELVTKALAELQESYCVEIEEVCNSVCVGGCMCVCVCVCVCVLGWGPQVLNSSPTLPIFHSVFLSLPPTSPTSLPSCDWVPGICWGANSRPFLMEQQWSR